MACKVMSCRNGPCGDDMSHRTGLLRPGLGVGLVVPQTPRETSWETSRETGSAWDFVVWMSPGSGSGLERDG